MLGAHAGDVAPPGTATDRPSAPEPRPPCPLRCPRVLTGRSAPPGSCRPTRGRHGLDTPLREVGATFAVPPALKGKALALRGTETTTRRPGPGRPAQRVTPAASANLQLLPPEQPDGAARATRTRVPVQSPPGGGAGQAGKTNMFSRGSWTERGHRAMSPQRGGARWLVLPRPVAPAVKVLNQPHPPFCVTVLSLAPINS